MKYTVIDKAVKSKMQFHIVSNIHLRLGYMMWVLQLLPVQFPYSRVELNTNVVGLHTETRSQDKKRRFQASTIPLDASILDNKRNWICIF